LKCWIYFGFSLFFLGFSAQELIEKNQEVEVDRENLERCLRVCASLGFVSEDEEGRFGPTLSTKLLSKDTQGNLSGILEMFSSPLFFNLFSTLGASLKSGKSEAEKTLGMPFFDYLHNNPEDMKMFAGAMESHSALHTPAILEKLEVPEHAVLVDVGGGMGHLAVALLQKHPHLKAIVLDRPELQPMFEKFIKGQDESVSSRLEFSAGDMFKSVPAGDIVVLKHIIHDWDDDHCVLTLKNATVSLKENGRIVGIDAVLPKLGDSSDIATKVMDVNMLVAVTGKERREDQWREIYEKAGLVLEKVVQLKEHDAMSLVIAKKK